ncbi:MAG: hypothetical protein ACC651_15890 [Candidatus Scalindua sp.]
MINTVFESKKPDLSLTDPLSTAVLVRYSRPFVSGVRARLREDALQHLSAAQRQKHDQLRAFRDKHIAHSVNGFEENQPVARYRIESVKEEGIASVECNHSSVSGLSSDDVEAVIELTTAMLSYVDSRLKEEKARVLKIVRKMPIEEILSKGQNCLPYPDLKKVHQRRPS